MSQHNDDGTVPVDPEDLAFSPDRGPDREQMASEYLPESDDWEGKTVLDLNDPAAIAALTNMDRMFPEVEDLQPLIDDFLEHFLKSRTSVGGSSREEYANILMSMYGGRPDAEDGATKFAKALAGDLDDDD